MWKLIERFSYEESGKRTDIFITKKGEFKKVITTIKKNKNSVITTRKEVMLQTRINKGYYCVRFVFRGKRIHTTVHRLLAIEFIFNKDPENKIQVNHIDGNKLNNNLNNLEWVTASENYIHAINTGLAVPTFSRVSTRGENSPVTRFKDDDIRYIRNSKKTGNELAKKFRVTPACISIIKKRKSWKHVK